MSLLDTQPAADYIGVKPHTLEVWRCTGRYGLPFLRVGGRIKYRVSDLDAWLASRTVTPIHEAESAKRWPSK
jgi:hypothetical protein